MTAMQITHEGAAYTLTTEASASSYGRPVLVAADGTQYGPADVVAVVPAYVDEIFGEQPARALTALDVAHAGQRAPIDGEVFRAADADGYMALTAYGHATADMFALFGRM